MPALCSLAFLLFVSTFFAVRSFSALKRRWRAAAAAAAPAMRAVTPVRPSPACRRPRLPPPACARPATPASPPELESLLALLRARQSAGGPEKRPPGRVHLVGTGPGGPELLTLAALRLMQAAEVVLYDRLVSPETLQLVNPSALLVYVGKAAGYHTRSQAEIDALLAAFASAGATVLRLKGGDPLVFGRGGEECAHLRRAGVSVSVTPGISAAHGIAAQLGLPLTHRGLSSSVRFLTGHAREAGEGAAEAEAAAPSFSFSAADAEATLVLYMGLGTLPQLVGQMRAGGLAASTPALAVERGTTCRQRRVFCGLEALPAAAAEAGLRSPTLIFVGRTVALSPLWPWGQTLAAGQGYVLQEGSPEGAEEWAGRSVRLPGGGAVALPAAEAQLRQPAEAQRKQGARRGA